MKEILGGQNFASCSIKCTKDDKFHSVDCGSNSCDTTPDNKVNCTSGMNIVSTTDPCANIKLDSFVEP